MTRLFAIAPEDPKLLKNVERKTELALTGAHLLGYSALPKDSPRERSTLCGSKLLEQANSTMCLPTPHL